MTNCEAWIDNHEFVDAFQDSRRLLERQDARENKPCLNFYVYGSQLHGRLNYQALLVQQINRKTALVRCYSRWYIA